VSTSLDTTALDEFLKANAIDGDRPVPARLQAALALLERLRDFPSVTLSDHTKPGSSGIRSHESYGDRALERLQLQPINKNHGRRSSNLPGWGQKLLNIVSQMGFASANSKTREQILDEAQKVFAAPLRTILDQDPLEARLRGRTAEAVLKELILARIFHN
jgi:hypothetical protein